MALFDSQVPNETLDTGLQVPGELILPAENVLPEQPIAEANSNRLSRAFHVAKTAAESSVVALELSPVSGIIRYGAAAAVLAATRDVPLSAAVLGGSTLALDGAAGVATADLVANNALPA